MSYEQPPSDGPAQPTQPTRPAEPSARSCTACGSTDLTPGFVEDRGQQSGGFARWIPGALERGVFGGARVLGKERWEIEAWRCSACGHLDHYVLNRA